MFKYRCISSFTTANGKTYEYNDVICSQELKTLLAIEQAKFIIKEAVIANILVENDW